MDFLWKFTDYFMDFKKVRVFQEFCGIKDANYACKNTQEIGSGEDLFNKNMHNKKLNDEYGVSQLQQKQRENFYGSQSSGNIVKPSGIPEKEYSKTYQITNWPLYYMFKFGSTLGHEIFYITFIPYVFWNFDPFIARKMVVVWVVTMYIGQALKDIIQWPRPSWPPVFKLETRVEAEYGIPSTHAVAGTALPFSFLLAMYGRYEFSLELGIVCACLWCSLVALSRLYVGMHSILDVITGIGLAAIYLWLGWPFMDMVEEYTMKSPYAPWIIILSHFLLGVFYPSTDHYSTSRGDTVIILAAGAGIHVATWMCYYYGFEFGPVGEPPYVLDTPTIHSLVISISRAVIGFLVLFVVRGLAKSASLSLVCHMVGVPKSNPSSRRRKDVEITYKFITYAMVGFSVLGITPSLFMLIGLQH